MVEADVIEVGSDRRGEVGIERALQFVRTDLDAGQSVVVADAELLEAPRPKQCLGRLDPAQPLFGDFEPRGNTRGETRHRGFFRDRETVRSGDLTDLELFDVGLQKRRVGVQLLDSPEAGAVALTRIGGVRPVTDRLDPEFPGGLEHRSEPHRPAVITAVVVVRREGVAFEFRKRDDLVADADLRGDPSRVLEFGGRERLAFRGTGDGPLAECLLGERGDDGRVNPAREGDEHAVELPEVPECDVAFGLDVHTSLSGWP